MRTALLSLLLLASLAHAENWPQWRGPRMDGTSLDGGFPLKADAKSLKWKVELPGNGHASPIVWGDRIFIVSAIAETGDRALLSLERASGKILWQSVVMKAPLEAIHH